MNMVRMTIAEAAYCFIAGDLPTGETVRVTTFFDMKSATSPVLTTNTATEIGATGKYYWCLDEMETSPAREMIVLWIMTAPVSGRTTWGVLHIGGYPGVVQSVVAGAITAAALAADAITADKIADDAIGADQIGAGAIVAATFAAGAIDAAAIKDAAIDLATFAADVKTGLALKANVETITANAITAAAINNDAITGQKVDTTAVTKIVGTAVALDGGAATIAGMLTKIADDNGGANFNAETDSLEAIANSEAVPPTVEQIADEIERVGGMLEAAKDAAVSAQEESEEVNAKLEAGSLAPNSVQFEPTV